MYFLLELHVGRQHSYQFSLGSLPLISPIGYVWHTKNALWGSKLCIKFLAVFSHGDVFTTLRYVINHVYIYSTKKLASPPDSISAANSYIIIKKFETGH